MSRVFMDAAQTEFEKSVSAIKNGLKHTVALTDSYHRYDDLIGSEIVKSKEKTACTAGCSYCCYYKVEVNAYEIFLIKEYLERKRANRLIEKILLEVKENVSLIGTLSHKQHMATNIKCPFLVDDKCIIYRVRPYKCRNFHAIDLNGCKRSYEEPLNFAIQNSFIQNVAEVGNGHAVGFRRAILTCGYDSRVYDLNTALMEAYSSSSSAKRYRKGKKSFLKAIEIMEE